jgi:peptidoglycan/xylan/chitin deacetylase (PgdA/CDA1 family)
LRAILTYHSIDDSGSVISTTARELDRQLATLASQKVQVVPLATLLTLDDDVDAVALTFDDGFANFASVAAPILMKRDMPATVFVVTGRVGKTNDWEEPANPLKIPSLALMGWDALRAMQDAGFEIGGHTVSHRRLDRCEASLLDSEIAGCAASIEHELGSKPLSFAYPYGAHDAASVSTAARVFGIACTTRFAALNADDSLHELPRLDMFYFRDRAQLEGWGSARFRAYIAMRSIGRQLRSAVESKH